MRLDRLAMTLVAGVMIGGCGKDGGLSTQVTELEAELKALKETVAMNEVLRDWEKIAYLTPGDGGYSLVKSDVGILALSIENIIPYASGSKVTLRFGNLTAATINGLKARIDWGAVDEKKLPINNNTRSRDISLNESLVSGSWTSSTVVLDGVPPGDLGFVRIRDVGHSGIRLRQ